MMTQFLASYFFFTAAATTYRGYTEEMRAHLDEKAVADAFMKATHGMSQEQQTMLTQFMFRLLQLPEEYAQQKKQRYQLASDLDRESTKNLSKLEHSKDVLSTEDFLARTGLKKEELDKSVREHRIFKLPHWAREIPIFGEELYPAFFTDPKYERSSLESVSKALRAFSGERKYRFFTTPNSFLDYKTPLEILADGEIEQVLNAAKAFRWALVNR